MPNLPHPSREPVAKKRYWEARVAMRTNLVETVQPLYQDLVNFAGELPPREWSVDGVRLAYYKRKGLDNHYLCLFNPDATTPTGEVTASLRLPEGVYEVQVWSLEDFKSLGEITAEDLARGVKLGTIPAMRMRTLRMKRIR